MGLNNSTVVLDVTPIEKNVTELNQKLQSNNLPIDSYVQMQIRSVLLQHLNAIRRNSDKKRNIRVNRTEELIKSTISNLDQTPTKHAEFTNHGLKKKKTAQNQLVQQSKNCIEDLRKKMKNNEIKAHEYDPYLNVVAQYSQQLNTLPKNKNTKQLRDAKTSISKLMLELFIKSPLTDLGSQENSKSRGIQTNNQEILKKMLNYSYAVKDMEAIFKKLDLKNFGPTELESIKNILYTSKTKVESMNETMQKHIGDLEEVNKKREDAVDNKQPITTIQNQVDAISNSTFYRLDEADIPQKTDNVRPSTRRSITGVGLNSSKDKHKTREKAQTSGGKNQSTFTNYISQDIQSETSDPNFQDIENYRKPITANKTDKPSDDKIAEYRNDLNEIKVFLRKCASNEGRLSLSVTRHLYQQRKEKIDSFRAHLKKIPDVNEEIATNKSMIFQEITRVLDVLKTDTQESEGKREYLGRLKTIENRINQIFSNPNIKEKRKVFNECTNMVNAINSFEAEVVHEKTKILNKLQSLQENIAFVESKDTLLQIQNILERHKKETQQFANPIRSGIYKQKTSEIASLADQIQKLPTGNQDEHKQFLLNEIHEVLQILDKNAAKQEEILRCRESLQNTEGQISAIERSTLPPEKKLKELEECRRKVGLVNNPDPEICAHKNRILNRLQAFNRTDSKNNFSKLTTSLAKLQAEAQKFNYPISTNAYQRKRDEITALEETLNTKPIEISNEEKRDFLDAVHETLRVLEKRANYHEETNRCLEFLASVDGEITEISRSKLSLQQKMEALKECTAKVDTITNTDREVSVEKMDVLKKIKNFEENIALQENKTKPKSAPVEKQGSSNILDLQQYFNDFNPDNVGVPKESMEYIGIIRDRAATYEDKVQQYSGTNYSVSYFVLDENLMRLLEALDKVKCHDNEPMLREKITTINYIKELHRRLDANVVDD